jgi:integrase
MVTINLETKTARQRLEARWKPYWLRLSGGISLGYRRSAGPGSWSVRMADGQRGNSIKRIAAADDSEPADGKAIMSFAQARDAALRLGRGETEQASVAAIVTLADAIDAYKADLASRHAGADNVTRLLHHVPPAMRKRPVALLDVTELSRWRDGLAKRLSPASINRTITVAKAVLNLAAARDVRLSTRPWEIGLASLPEATKARNVVLPEATIRLLIGVAREQSAEFGLLVEALALTGARVSQLARCQVRDLMGDRLMIPSSAKGQGKRSSRTPVPIPSGLSARLLASAPARNAAPADPLFVKPAGEPWSKSDHSRPFARAVATIGEDPNVVSSYALRHSHITAQLLARLPVQLVARLHDTSAAMLEKHYAAEIASHADDLVRASFMDVDRPAAEVVPLQGAGG